MGFLEKTLLLNIDLKKSMSKSSPPKHISLSISKALCVQTKMVWNSKIALLPPLKTGTCQIFAFHCAGTTDYSDSDKSSQIYVQSLKHGCILLLNNFL